MSAFSRMFTASKDKRERIKYESTLPKWELQEESYTLDDIKWFCDLIRDSNLPEHLKEYFLAWCEEVDLSEANAYVRDVAQTYQERAPQKLAREQARKTLFQDVQTKAPSGSFNRPGKTMQTWTWFHSKSFQALFNNKSPRHRQAVQAIAVNCRRTTNPLQLEKEPALVRELAIQVFVQFLCYPGEDESASRWLVDMYTACELGLQLVWWHIWKVANGGHEPAETGSSLSAVLDHTAVVPEAPHTDVPEFGHRHKSPNEGADGGGLGPFQIMQLRDLAQAQPVDPSNTTIITQIGLPQGGGVFY